MKIQENTIASNQVEPNPRIINRQEDLVLGHIYEDIDNGFLYHCVSNYEDHQLRKQLSCLSDGHLYSDIKLDQFDQFLDVTEKYILQRVEE